MSIERARAYHSTPSTHISRKLCFTIVIFVGVICISGGYVLGNVARIESKKYNDIITHNLTTATEQLYKKVKRLSPKTINLHDPVKVGGKLIEIFNCKDCRQMDSYNVIYYVRNLVNSEVVKLIKIINTASAYMDTLR